MADLADVLGLERFAVFGASGGGPYALACARRIPERITTVAIAGGVGPFDAPGMAPAVALWRGMLFTTLPRARVPLSLGLRFLPRRALADPHAFLD